MSSNKILNQRQLRFGELIRKIISDCFNLGVIPDDRLNDFSITVSRVIMSKDLKIANIYLSSIGKVSNTSFIDIINENKYILQKKLSQEKLKSKFTPKINFFIDDSFEEAERIEKLLLNKKVLRDLTNE